MGGTAQWPPLNTLLNRNMVFPQILSYMPLLFDQWLPRYMNYPLRHSRDNIFGGGWLENGSNPQNINFQQVLDHLLGFKNYIFFDFQKFFFTAPALINQKCANENASYLVKKSELRAKKSEQKW